MAIVTGNRPVLWVMFDTIATSLVSIGSMLVIARLAGPSEFVTAALIVGAVMFANINVEVLFHDALIQNRDVTEIDFDHAISIVLTIALGIVALVAIVALLLFNGPYSRIGWLSITASFYLLFSGPNGVANARQRKKMEYRHVARASVIGRALGCATGIIVALEGHGTLGLILQNTAGAFAQSVILFSTTRWRPRLRFSLDGKLRHLLRYALPDALMNSLVSARIQAFSFLVASFSGLTTAGYINIAFRLTTTPQLILITALGNLCFPMIAAHQTSKYAQAQAFQLTTKIISATTLPLFVGLALISKDLVPLVLGRAWLPAIPLVTILAIACAVYFSRMSSSLLLRATGTVRYSVWNAVFQLSLTIGGLLIFRPTDAFVAIYLWIFPLAIQVPITLLIMRRLAGIGIFDQLKGLIPSMCATGCMGAAILLIKLGTLAWSPLSRLCLSLAVGGAVFVLVILKLDRQLRDFAFRKNTLVEPSAQETVDVVEM
jgi:teichuronic acid exporter